MTGIQLNFDARAVSPAGVDGGMEQFPVSDALGHLVVIVGDEVAKSKAGDDMLVFKERIIEGPFAGLEAPHRFNIGHSKQQVKEIAYAQLSSLCHAIGVFAVGNTQELYNKPFRVVVEAQAGDAKFTQIKGVLTQQGIDPGNPSAGPRQAKPAAAASEKPPAQTFTATPAPGATAFGSQQPPAQAQPQPQPQPAATVWTPPATDGAKPPAAHWSR